MPRRVQTGAGPTDMQELLANLRRPPSARFKQLIINLIIAGQCDDELNAAGMALFSVVGFLEEVDPRIARTGLTRPLRNLLANLRDLRGGRPPLFSDQPRKRGRPANRSAMAPRGAIAAVVDLLITGGESRLDAAQFVCAELHRAGIRGHRGKAITATLVLRWRDATGGGASDLTEQTHDSMHQKLANLPAEAVATTADRRKVVRGVVQALWSAGF